MNISRRRFVRHIAGEMPFELRLSDIAASHNEYLNDISLGGLSFRSKVEVTRDVTISVRIPLVRPVFETTGRVVWCTREKDHYNVGVQFMGPHDRFKIRMVQQICHIEKYKQDILEKEGRALTGEQAALEWIQKYAHLFID